MISTLASAGNGLELKCGIDSDAVIWKKQGAQLSDDKRSHQLTVSEILLSNIYSCHRQVK